MHCSFKDRTAAGLDTWFYYWVIQKKTQVSYTVINHMAYSLGQALYRNLLCGQASRCLTLGEIIGPIQSNKQFSLAEETSQTVCVLTQLISAIMESPRLTDTGYCGMLT